jgi:hypothetical protein
MSFTTQKLVGHRVLVTGADILGNEGSMVLDSTQWDEVNDRKEFSQAEADFDAAVEAFFAPLNEAADAVKAKLEKPEDPTSYVVLSEGTEGVKPEPAVLVRLSPDSVVLRIIESGNTDRLVWVLDRLEVLETVAVQAP